MSQRVCPKCNSAMDEVLIRGITWSKKLGPGRYVERPFEGHRCPKCGFLELYAITE